MSSCQLAASDGGIVARCDGVGDGVGWVVGSVMGDMVGSDVVGDGVAKNNHSFSAPKIEIQ